MLGHLGNSKLQAQYVDASIHFSTQQIKDTDPKEIIKTMGYHDAVDDTMMIKKLEGFKSSLLKNLNNVKSGNYLKEFTSYPEGSRAGRNFLVKTKGILNPSTISEGSMDKFKSDIQSAMPAQRLPLLIQTNSNYELFTEELLHRSKRDDIYAAYALALQTNNSKTQEMFISRDPKAVEDAYKKKETTTKIDLIKKAKDELEEYEKALGANTNLYNAITKAVVVESMHSGLTPAKVIEDTIEKDFLAVNKKKTHIFLPTHIGFTEDEMEDFIDKAYDDPMFFAKVFEIDPKMNGKDQNIKTFMGNHPSSEWSIKVNSTGEGLVASWLPDGYVFGKKFMSNQDGQAVQKVLTWGEVRALIEPEASIALKPTLLEKVFGDPGRKEMSKEELENIKRVRESGRRGSI
jgi:hypothetical protein